MSNEFSNFDEITIGVHQIADIVNAMDPDEPPPIFWGAPGIGKSAGVRSLTDNLWDVRLAHHEPTDAHFPLANFDAREVEFVPTGLFPTDDREGILFLDEITNASRATQTLALQVALDRKFGSHDIGPNYKIVAASNRLSDRAGGNTMISSLASRFTHYNVVVDADAWSLWALGAGLNIDVISFLRFRKGLLHDFDATAQVSPNPRGWEYVSRKLEQGRLSGQLRYATIAGKVGLGAANEFEAFLKDREDCPSVDEIIAAPKSARVPPANKSSALFGVAGALGQSATPQNIGAIITYVERLPSVEYNVFAIQAARFAAKAKGTLAALQAKKEFIDWLIRHNEVIAG